jgi:hypothetical protein
MSELSDPIASVFVSYSHHDRGLAREIEERLDAAGYRVWIDDGELHGGDSIITSVADAIDQVDFLVALVSDHSVGSPWCRKELALAMTGEISQKGITVIPLRVNGTQMPPTLADKKYVAVAAGNLDASVAALVRDMQSHLDPPDPLPPRKRAGSAIATRPSSAGPLSDSIPSLKVIGIDLEHLGKPRNDNTPGSALYAVPFELNGDPDAGWSGLLVRNWDRPPRYTSMHRPGIASVRGRSIVLDGTTIEEVRRYHLATLKLAVEVTNREYADAIRKYRDEAATAERIEKQRLEEAHRIAEELTFD